MQIDLQAVAQFIKEFQSIIAVCIAVVGWIITHALTLRAQRMHLKNQAVNEARIELGEAIREFQGAILTTRKAFDNIMMLDEGLFVVLSVLPDNIHQHLETIQNLHKPVEFSGNTATGKWARLLEDNEILFPYTRTCREQLLNRYANLMVKIVGLCVQIVSTTERIDPKNRRATLQEVKGLIQASSIDVKLDHYLRLLEDLLVYLQNRSLGPVVGKTIDFRSKNDGVRPMVVEVYNGDLEIRCPGTPE